MKYLLHLGLAALLCLAAQNALAGGSSESLQAKPLSVGETFPDLDLAKLDQNGLAYLGLDKQVKPSLSGLAAKTVIVEVFSMYCPYCQREAPEMNRLFELLKENGLAENIKIIGLGAGNSQAEIEVFRDKYKPGFGLLPDPDFVLYKACGEVGTPFFYVLSRSGNKEPFKIVLTSLGRMESPESFLEKITPSSPSGPGEKK